MSALVYQGFKLSFGILYPAYSSFKAVRSKDVKGYVKWMMYWIVFALYVCVEALTDIILFWFPFYCELKICFIVWLIAPMTKGSSLLYRKVIHPQLVKREAQIDGYIGRARDQGYQAFLALGARGFSFATNVVVTTAIKGSDQLKRSFSFGDLSMDENQMMRLKRLGSTASLDSVDEMDSNAEDEEMYRRDLSGVPLRRDLADNRQLDELDREINDLPRLQPRGSLRRPGQLTYNTKISGSDAATSAKFEPTVGSVRLSRKHSLLTKEEILRELQREGSEDLISAQSNPTTPSVSDSPRTLSPSSRYARSESLDGASPPPPPATGSAWQSRSSYATSSLQAATTLYRRH